MKHSRSTFQCLSTRCSAAALAAALLAATGIGHAQQYPVKPIRVIVPYAAGGSPDVLTRVLAKDMEPRLGQPVLVEARPGAAAMLGHALVAKAPPDGYTVLLGSNSGISGARGIYKTLSYDPINDFAGITIYSEGSLLLVAGPEEKGFSVPQIIERIRTNPAKYSMGGPNFTAQVFHKLIANATKVDNTYVPYKDSNVMVGDLLGGRLGLAAHTMTGSIPMIKAGKMTPIAVTVATRMPSMPDVPAMAEFVPGAAVGFWLGFFAPAKTPKPIIDTLHRNLVTALKTPDALNHVQTGGRPMYLTPEETDAFIRKDEARWLQMYKTAGIQPE